MRSFWIICLALLVLVLVVLAGYLLIGFLSYRLALTRKGKIKRFIEKNYAKHLQSLSIDEKYFEEGFEKIIIRSEDNLRLMGFYKTCGHNKIALLVHGYGGNHKEMANYAKFFEKRGYDILAFDMRCHGQSEGIDLTMGLKESKDLLLWISKVVEINPQYKIVLFGLSMGASTVCIACGENLPQNVVLAIEDCGYDNANKQFYHVYKSKIRLKLFYKIFYNFTKKSRGLELSKVDPAIALKNAKVPIMFIHGGNDDFVPTEMIYSLSQHVPEQRKRIYLAENAGHAGAYAENPSRYEREVSQFLSQYYM